ncbi:MAG: hypothetical protein OXU31_04985 [Gammaproteobacteria bacterium]|nr:hypothetical protein [Gammaproteobacteria bacterium]
MPAGKNDETKSASFYAKWERMRQELKSEPLQVLLAVLHQKFEQVLDLVPNLDRINDLSEIPGEKSKVVKNLLWEIAIPDMLRLEEEMDGLISQGVLHKVKGPGAFSYYMDVYKPRRKKTQQLLGFKSADALARHENSIKSTLETVIETSDLYIDRLDEELAESWKEWMSNMEGLDSVVGAFYFKPDEWHANSKDLTPIFVEYEPKKIPARIRDRIQEIHLSYIFGNWMAVAALCRSLLEFMILDCKSALGLQTGDLYQTEDMKKSRQLLRPLGEIISRLTTISAATKSDMYYIIRRGNRIMHWPKSKWANIEDLRSRQKADARECLARTAKIISALYRSPPLRR